MRLDIGKIVLLERIESRALFTHANLVFVNLVKRARDIKGLLALGFRNKPNIFARTPGRNSGCSPGRSEEMSRVLSSCSPRRSVRWLAAGTIVGETITMRFVRAAEVILDLEASS
jgi:hypothetical protein